jgi:hypothetical protein
VITVSGKAWLASTSWNLLIEEQVDKKTGLSFLDLQFSLTNPVMEGKQIRFII